MLAVLACTTVAVFAQSPDSPTLGSPVALMALDWQNLSAEQKRLLEPLASEWNGLEAASRVRWMELTARYPSLPSEEQRRLEERIAQWARLSPVERQAVRLSFQQARQIKPEDRAAKWEAYQALPQERRNELADRAAKRHSKPPATMGSTVPAASAVAHAAGPGFTPMPAPAVLAPAPTLRQAKPGATTVLTHAWQTPAPHPVERRFYKATRLNTATLLAKPVAGEPSAQGSRSSE